jgi:hypothetical protein
MLNIGLILPLCRSAFSGTPAAYCNTVAALSNAALNRPAFAQVGDIVGV